MFRSFRVLAVAVALCSVGATGSGHGRPVTPHDARAHARPRHHAHPPHTHRHRHWHRHGHWHRRGHLRRHRHWHRIRRRPKLYGVTPRMMQMAERVSVCEEGGNWHFRGTVFDGGLGWTLSNWVIFRKPHWPRWMHDAPPHMQANALFRFVRHFGIAMPDQSGACAGY